MRELPTRKLDRRIKRVWRLSAVLHILIWGFLFCCLPLGVAFLMVSDAASGGSSAAGKAAGILLWVFVSSICVLVLLFVVFVAIAPRIRWKRWSFEIGDQEIDICKGIFWRKRIIIPLIRVQNVDTRQGPIMRANGLSSLTVATAAGEHEIPGLDVAEADSLRDHAALLARMAQEDV